MGVGQIRSQAKKKRTLHVGVSTRVRPLHVGVRWISLAKCGNSPSVGEIAQLGTWAAWIVGGVLAVCTVLNTLAAVLLARASLPQRLESRLQRVLAEVDAMGKAIEDFGRQNAAHESTLRGLEEEARDAFERAERKRASAAATLSRQMNTAEQAPRTRAELINQMRRADSGWPG